MVAPPHTQLIYLRCNSVVTVLITPEVFEVSPNRRQGDPLAVKADHPSQVSHALAPRLISTPSHGS